jgi:hypothetical protein
MRGAGILSVRKCHVEEWDVGVSRAPLSVSHPKLAAEWHPTRNAGLTPDSVTSDSQVRVWWLCPDKPEQAWQAVVADRVSGKALSPCGGVT